LAGHAVSSAHDHNPERDVSASRAELLLLPGLTNDARVWQGVADRLADVARVQVADLTTGDTMADLADAVLAKAPPRFAVAGLSMGGYCALEIVARAPERVIALGLVDTSARPDTPEGRANRERQIARASTEFPAIVDELLPKWVHPGRLADPSVADVVRAMARDRGPEAFIRQQRAIMNRADSRPRLGAIRCPTVVVCGREDVLLPLEVHEEMARGIAGATLRVIDACGHLAPLERPAEVAAALRELLEK
jgi:pimeloyl-ACP methyl ester carboxylesterase